MKKQEPRQDSVGARMIRGLQELAEALEKKEPIAAAFTFRQIELDLRASAYDAARVKALRKQLGVSQGVFALLLGVKVGSVRSWEQGINTPSAMARRFMDEMRRDPSYWIERLHRAAVRK